jgi:hypothetical protein
MTSVLLVAALVVATYLVQVKNVQPAESGSQYTDSIYMFSINPLDLGKAEGATQRVTFFGPPVDGFAANANVMIQAHQPGLDQYVETTKKQVQQVHGKIISTKKLQVSGHDAAQLEYTMHLGKHDLHFLALAVFVDDQVYLTTCTDTEANFEDHRQPFQSCLDSFKLNP